jgi:hypothetical protein
VESGGSGGGGGIAHKALYNGTTIPAACTNFKTLTRMLLSSSPQMADNYVEWQKITPLPICNEELTRM